MENTAANRTKCIHTAPEFEAMISANLYEVRTQYEIRSAITHKFASVATATVYIFYGR